MKLFTLFTIAALAIVFSGCGGAGIEGRGPKTYENAGQIVTEAKAGVDRIEIDAFKVKMDSDDMFVVIDVREPDDYYEDSIPGAINIPRGILEFKIADEKYWDSEGLFAPGKDEEIIVYGHKVDRGVLAAETLVKLGYKNVKHLYGGWIVWTEGPEALDVEEVVEEGGCGG